MSKSKNPSQTAAKQAAVEEVDEVAARAEILFEHPNMVPERPGRRLSPREMVAATHEPRAGQTQDSLLWMTETPLNAIDKDGIDLLRRTFTGLDLLPLTTGPKNRLRRDLVMRYNRAELARGILKEIVVLERDSQGVYHELGRAQRSDVFRQDVDFSVVLRERARYIDELLEKVHLDQEAFVRLEAGTSSLEDLVGAIQARERFQRRARPKAIVSTPRWDSTKSARPEADADYEAMMANRPEAAERSADAVPAELRLADVIAGATTSDGSSSGGAGAQVRKSDGRKKSSRKKSSRKKSERAKSEGRKKTGLPSGSEPEDIDAVPPLAGGATSLADLLSSAPLPSDEDD